MFATAEDLLTPSGVLAVANKYSELGLPYELHIFQHGPHGYALADETSADGSSRYLNPAFAQWHGLSVQWLYRIFGAPSFEDKISPSYSFVLYKAPNTCDVSHSHFIGSCKHF